MITDIINLGATLVGLASRNKLLSEDNARTAGKLMAGAKEAYNVISTNSVSQSAGKTLISPMVAVEDTLIHAEYMADLMTIVNLRDIKDTLSHLSMQGEVNGIKISSLVDAINPRRGGFLSLAGAESFGSVAGFEALKKPEEEEKSKKAVQIHSGTSKQMQSLTEYQPLALGRTVEASVMIDGTQVTFPLTFRQVPVPVSSNDLESIFEAARPQDGMYARFIMYKAGELTLPEFLTGTDQIKREFNIRKNDMSGYYSEAMGRAEKNRMAALRTGVVSMNSMANTIILSSDTARNIELELGVRFNSSGIAKIRKSVMANTIVVVNDGLGIFTFYTSSNNIPEEFTRKEITVISKKDTSMDLSSLMKLFGGR